MCGTLFIFALVLAWLLAAAPGAAQNSGDAKRGEYLAQAAGCLGCHTDAKDGATPFAGGRALKTPFGTFFGPNITPDPQNGIGRWTEADFRRAMRQGIRPDGAYYFPAFPYGSFTGMSDGDLRDLFAYLRSLKPTAQPSKPHDLGFPFNIRFAVLGWRILYFDEGGTGTASGAQARGAYLVEVLGHCGECHTPRTVLGGMRADRRYAGSAAGPAGGKIPNITPAGLGKWSDGDLKEFLGSGMTPDGDFAGGEMAEVIRNSSSKLTPEDLQAMVGYLRSLPARR
jgi:mono/diheme cytochrome c family protein